MSEVATGSSEVPENLTLAAVAAYGLSGTGLSLPEGPLDDEAFGPFLRRVETSKLIGLAAAAAANGDLVVTPAQRANVAEAHRQAMCHTLRLEAILLESVAVLDAAGIPSKVLKGSAVAQLDYEDPFLRPFVDVDLLVPSDSFDEAVRLLVRSGAQRLWAPPRAGFDRRFGKGATLRTPDGYELDLHRTFVQGPWGLTVSLDDLWSESQVIVIGGRELQTLSDAARLLHAAIHATLGHSAAPAYVPSRDIAEMVLFGTVVAEEALHLASRWQMEAVLAEGISRAWSLLDVADVTSLSAWAEGFSPSELDRRRRAVYLPGNESYTAKSLATLSTLPRFRDRLALVSSLAFPDRQFLTDHETTYRQWIRRGVGNAVRARRSR